jgi:hypothetical protein
VTVITHCYVKESRGAHEGSTVRFMFSSSRCPGGHCGSIKGPAGGPENSKSTKAVRPECVLRRPPLRVPEDCREATNVISELLAQELC